MENKIIKFETIKEKTDLHEVFNQILQHEDKLKDVVLIWRTEIPEEQKEKMQAESFIDTYWSGENSVIDCLGLIEYMKHEILDYIDNENE